jgi:CDP-diacylglycerol--glycerol-3-phosphate 3-phosphatidyltransferase
MTLPIALTSSRLVLSPLFFLAFFVPIWTGSLEAASVVMLWIIFIAVEVTDYADGAVARSRNQISDLGKLMDPFADVISRVTYFLCFSLVGIMPAWVLIVIFYREFGIIFIRLLMYREGTALAARRGGKTKALLYFASAGLSLIVLTLERLEWLVGWHEGLRVFVAIVYVGAAVMAIVSFVDYLRVFRMRSSADDVES